MVLEDVHILVNVYFCEWFMCNHHAPCVKVQCIHVFLFVGRDTT